MRYSVRIFAYSVSAAGALTRASQFDISINSVPRPASIDVSPDNGRLYYAADPTDAAMSAVRTIPHLSN